MLVPESEWPSRDTADQPSKSFQSWQAGERDPRSPRLKNSSCADLTRHAHPIQTLEQTFRQPASARPYTASQTVCLLKNLGTFWPTFQDGMVAQQHLLVAACGRGRRLITVVAWRGRT